MRNPLFKRIPRDIRSNAIKYIGMCMILISTIAVGSAFNVTMSGAKDYLENIKEDNFLEDGYFEIPSELSKEDIFYFSDRNVIVSPNFYVTDHSFGDDTKVLFFGERDSMDIPTVFEGRMPSKKGETVLDHVFAKGHNIAVGDYVSILGDSFLVTGTVSLPDYSSLFMNNTDLVMNTAHFGVGIVADESFDELKNSNMTARYSYRFEDRTLSLNQKSEKAEEMMKYLAGTGNIPSEFLRADQNQSITFLEMDIGTDEPIMKVFVYLLVALIAFIFAVLTNGTIDRESVIIGTLRALGYSKGEIIMHYITPTLVIAFSGSVIGNVLGYTAMIDPFMSLYYTTYSIGPIDIKFSVTTFIITTVLPVIIMIGINYIMLAQKLGLSPLRFLRHDIKKKKNSKATKLPNVDFTGRFRMRVILQNRGSFVILFIGVFLASFLLMFGIGLKPLMDHYTENINDSLPYEYQYILKSKTDVEDGEKIFVYDMKTRFELGKKDISITCYGIGEDSIFFIDALSNEGISISSAMAKKLNLKVGDIFVLSDPLRECTYELTVAKIYPYEAMLSVFMPMEQLNEMVDAPSGTYNCVLADKKLNIDEKYVAKMIGRNDLLGASRQMLDSFGTVIKTVNVFSVVVYIIIMYIMTKVVIDQNALYISYLKVFGYNSKEIRKLYLSATSIVVFVSLFICIPLEVLLFKGVLVFLSSLIEGYLEFYLPPWIYAAIIAIGIGAYSIINAIHVGNVKKIPMTEALKTRE